MVGHTKPSYVETEFGVVSLILFIYKF